MAELSCTGSDVKLARSHEAQSFVLLNESVVGVNEQCSRTFKAFFLTSFGRRVERCHVSRLMTLF